MFAILVQVFHAGPELFRTAWFIESMATQILVIFVIRTWGPHGAAASMACSSQVRSGR
jgi:hypothetical protein